MATATLTPLVNYLLAVGPTEPDAVLLSRFARGGDESAFAELVRRHGPAVLGACRRILRDGHAAEDAFQATFLLLARKAGSLQQPERLANWLYGVACRTAMKLRSRLGRQKSREYPFDESAVISPDESDADLGPELDAAIQQLPSKYRVPFVLCYLQGLTNAEAAVRLGCPTNTVATRLSRARERLRFRLSKQGLTAAVSAGLVAATARSAACGVGASPEVLTLMEGVRTAMMWKKVKLAVAAVAVVALTGVGAGRLAFRAGAESPDSVGQPSRSQAAIPPPVAGRHPAASGDRIPPLDVTDPTEKPRNFVVTGTAGTDCAKIAIAAERHRKDLAKLWLGKELDDWAKPCSVRVSITHGPSASATTFQFSEDFEIGGMSLSGSREKIFADLLPHEVMHTVLATQFRQPIPRWADEGAAGMAESAKEQTRHVHLMVGMLKEGRAMRLAHLFKLTEYPTDIMALYAQGYTVTRFLVESHDRARFLDFVGAGMHTGWEAAAKGCYRQTLSEMEKAWIDWLRKTVRANSPARSQANADATAYAPPQPLPADEPLPANQPLPADQPLPPQLTPAPDAPAPPPPAVAVAPAGDPLQAPPSIPQPVPSGYYQPQQAAPVYQAAPTVQVEPTYDTNRAANGLTVVQAVMDKDGMVVCKFPKTTYYEPVTSYQRNQAGDTRIATAYVRRSVQEERAYRLDQLHVTATNGKPVDDKDVAKRLEKETTAIFCQGARVDPQLLPLLKDGTLIITLGPSVAPPLPHAPPVAVTPQ